MDRVQPEDFILRQITNKGRSYVNGIYNFSTRTNTAAPS